MNKKIISIFVSMLLCVTVFSVTGATNIEKDNNITFKSYPLADEKTKWDETEAIKQIKENTGSTKSPSKNYDVGFMFCDSDKKEEYNLSNYHM